MVCTDGAEESDEGADEADLLASESEQSEEEGLNPDDFSEDVSMHTDGIHMKINSTAHKLALRHVSTYI